jgi:hypothetical protein
MIFASLTIVLLIYALLAFLARRNHAKKQ